jgi:transcriptional regulator with XRE-family HTH domain
MAKPTPEVHSLVPAKSYEQLDVEDHLLILHLKEKGLPQTTIAQRLGCDQSTVSRSLQKHSVNSVSLTKALAESTAYEMLGGAIDIAKKGKDDETKLKAIKHVHAVAGLGQSNQGFSGTLNVLIAQPGKPETWGPEPVFEGELLGESPTASSEDNAKK